MTSIQPTELQQLENFGSSSSSYKLWSNDSKQKNNQTIENSFRIFIHRIWSDFTRQNEGGRIILTRTFWNIPHSNRCWFTMRITYSSIIFMMNIHGKHPWADGYILIAKYSQTAREKLCFNDDNTRAYCKRLGISSQSEFQIQKYTKLHNSKYPRTTRTENKSRFYS